MVVGCVREIKHKEYRVGLTPADVREYVAHGHTVLLEAGAGAAAGYPDEQYVTAGAAIAQNADEVWAACDMVVKVKEPLEEEYPKIREGQLLFTYLHLAASKPLTQAMLQSGCAAVAYETVRGVRGGLPLLRPMSEVAGRLSVQEGAKCLERPQGGLGLLLGGVPGVPAAKVLVLGGGVVGSAALKIAVGMEADITVLDTNLERLAYLDDLYGGRIHTLYSTKSAVEEALPTADLVIGAVLLPGAAAPKLLERRHLAMMRPGAVIVDVAVDQGGCCETTHPTYHDDPTYVVDGVVHYCVANMPGAVPRTSTRALTNATLPYGLALADYGLEDAIRKDAGLAEGLNCFYGSLTCRQVAQSLDLPYTPMEQALGRRVH